MLYKARFIDALIESISSHRPVAWLHQIVLLHHALFQCCFFHFCKNPHHFKELLAFFGIYKYTGHALWRIEVRMALCNSPEITHCQISHTARIHINTLITALPIAVAIYKMFSIAIKGGCTRTCTNSDEYPCR